MNTFSKIVQGFALIGIAGLLAWLTGKIWPLLILLLIAGVIIVAKTRKGDDEEEEGKSVELPLSPEPTQSNMREKLFQQENQTKERRSEDLPSDRAGKAIALQPEGVNIQEEEPLKQTGEQSWTPPGENPWSNPETKEEQTNSKKRLDKDLEDKDREISRPEEIDSSAISEWGERGELRLGRLTQQMAYWYGEVSEEGLKRYPKPVVEPTKGSYVRGLNEADITLWEVEFMEEGKLDPAEIDPEWN